jgi:hypothetical protein
VTDDELILKLKSLLRRCLPYVQAHYERSRVSFGDAARDLMNEIKSLLGIR